MNFYRRMMATCDNVGLPILGNVTSAKLLAIVYTYNDERLTASPKVREDLAYIQRKYRLQGGEIPDVGMAKLFNQFAAKLKGTDTNDGKIPYWVTKFLSERYEIDLK